MITVIQQGEFTTIQDKGRWGYQAYGMPVAGAMDQFAYRISNLLVGNTENAAAIEMTGTGAAFKFSEEQFIAVCGADMRGELNGVSINNWSSFLIPKRSELIFQAAAKGYRTYLAVRGGINVPMVLGSRSTYTRANIGGYEGRPLRKGDVLYPGENIARDLLPRKLASQYIPEYRPEVNLRIILGPQDTMFADKSIQTLLSNTYTVSEQSSRTGYQLIGPRILTNNTADIVSDAVGLGAVQIPSSGLPYIVTADHGTTRGFAKLGYVIQVDLSKLAQLKPGDLVRFSCLTEQEAIDALIQERQYYKAIAK